MIQSKGFACHAPGEGLVPIGFERRDPGPEEVEIELQYCGVCHSDVHMVDNDFGFSLYPMVPGHEMVGRVVRTGPGVAKLQAGDIVGVGCFSDSCRVCSSCEEGLEQYCDSYPTASFSAYERGTTNLIFGGFSSNYVVDERFAVKIPPALDPARAAPLLCGGITTYSALRYQDVRPGCHIGVVGIGGLGHLAVKFGHAMGAHVVCFTTSPDKQSDAVRLGADEVVLTTDAGDMNRFAGTLDLVIDTVSAGHDLNPLLNLLRRDGTLGLLGMPYDPVTCTAMILVSRRRSIWGSGVGGLLETQEMLDFCGDHGIAADVEVLPVDEVNTAIDRLKRNDVKYRFVLDLGSLKED